MGIIFKNVDTLGMNLVCQECHNRYPALPCEHVIKLISDGDDDLTAHSGLIALYAMHTNTLLFSEIPWLGWTSIKIKGVGPDTPFHTVELVHSRPDSTKHHVKLGLLAGGEGRKTICYMVLDYALSQLDPKDTWQAMDSDPLTLHTKCPSGMHTLRQQRAKINIETHSVAARHKMMFALAIERACIPCLIDAFGELGEGDEPSNYGMGDEIATKAIGGMTVSPELLTPVPSPRVPPPIAPILRPNITSLPQPLAGNYFLDGQRVIETLRYVGTRETEIILHDPRTGVETKVTYDDIKLDELRRQGRLMQS